MRKSLSLLFIVLVFFFHVQVSMGLDVGRVLRKVAGEAINSAISDAVSQESPYYTSPQEQQYQPQESQTYTYEEYIAAQAKTEGNENMSASELSGKETQADNENQENIPSAKQADDFDLDNPFAGLVAAKEEAPSANPGDDSGGREGSIIEVVATGIGKDSDGALRNALRSAIEQAVGTLVDSETLAKNDEVVSDQILSYSSGFVESHKVIGEPKSVDGLVTIKIQAHVRRTKLVEKLQAANIHIKKVDGESLFGEAITKLEQSQSAVEILTKAFSGFPETLLEAKMIGKPSYDEESRKLKLKIEVALSMDKYYEFTKSVIGKLKSIDAKQERIIIKLIHTSPEGFYEPGNQYLSSTWPSSNIIAICLQINEARTNSTWEVFTVSNNIRQAVRKEVKRPRVFVEILGENKVILNSGVYKSPVPYMVYGYRVGGGGNSTEFPNLLIPVLMNSEYFPARGGYVSPGKDKATLNISFDVSPQELKKMRSVECRIE